MRTGATALSLAVTAVITATPAIAAPVTTNCSTLLNSIVKTDVALSAMVQSNSFSLFPGATVTINVPAGTTRCIKVIFMPGDWSVGFSGGEFAQGAFVRALANTTALNPAQPINNPQKLKYFQEWVRRLGPGYYNIQVHIQPQGGFFSTKNWVMEVQVLQ